MPWWLHIWKVTNSPIFQTVPFFKQSQFSNGPNFQTVPIFKRSQFSNGPNFQTVSIFKQSQFSSSPNFKTAPIFKQLQFSSSPNFQTVPIFKQPQFSHLCLSFRYRRNLVSFQQNSHLLNLWAIFTVLVAGLVLMVTLDLQPSWFSPHHLFWSHKLLYFVFVDIFHALVLPVNMARVVPWIISKEDVGSCSFYVRKPKNLEPRPPISKHSRGGCDIIGREGTDFATRSTSTFIEEKQQRDTNQTPKIMPVFPNKTFRLQPPRETNKVFSTEEPLIWTSRSDFGHHVLWYTRHHLSQSVNIDQGFQTKF